MWKVFRMFSHVRALALIVFNFLKTLHILHKRKKTSMMMMKYKEKIAVEALTKSLH